MSLNNRIALLVVLAVAGGAAFFGLDKYKSAAPDCDSEVVLHDMGTVLRDRDHLDSIFVNNVTTESGGWFSATRECSAEVATIRGDVAASNLPWREVRYRIGVDGESGQASVAVTLGGDVPLAGPEPSWWSRLLALF
jgi:hypothetical protein